MGTRSRLLKFITFGCIGFPEVALVTVDMCCLLGNNRDKRSLGPSAHAKFGRIRFTLQAHRNPQRRRQIPYGPSLLP